MKSSQKSRKINKSPSVRITSGTFRGQEISTPVSAHPMGSRERLALMNSLAPYLKNATVLDAYAGSGALGIEALSRGAASATFLEKSPAAAGIIKDNLKKLGIPAAQTKVVKGTTANFHPSQKYTIILLDPPYDDYHPADFAHLAECLAPGGILALSHPAAAAPDFPQLKLLSSRKYARCHIAIFQSL